MMHIEEEIFKKAKLNKEKLLEYGFKYENDVYNYSKNILDNSFSVHICIDSSGIVSGKIYDLSFNEEYTSFRIEEAVGDFVNSIRTIYKDILEDIKAKCFNEEYFMNNQANRLAKLIYDKYGCTPEFAWEKFPSDGIFKNSSNNKWFGLIMNIDRSKIESGSGMVDILNVKLNPDNIKKLLTQNGFYKAYHMNKDNWITIILDETISDEEIMKYIDESYNFSKKSHKWLVPVNPEFYDVINHFCKFDTINWKQPRGVNIGDIIYLYVAKPYSAILYKCEVIKINIPYEYKDKNLSMTKVMTIKLLKEYKNDMYTLNELNKYGVKTIRGPRSMPDDLCKIMDSN